MISTFLPGKTLFFSCEHYYLDEKTINLGNITKSKLIDNAGKAIAEFFVEITVILRSLINTFY